MGCESRLKSLQIGHERLAAVVMMADEFEHFVKTFPETTWDVYCFFVIRGNHQKHGNRRTFGVLIGADFKMIHLLPAKVLHPIVSA